MMLGVIDMIIQLFLSLSPSAKPSSSALSPAVKCCPVAEGQGSRGSSESAPPREPDKDAFITDTHTHN